jgi:hypothetical protein
MKSKMSLVLIICLIPMFFDGCATIFSGGRGSFRASSDPSGAEVWVNGERMGQTPVTLRLKTKDEYHIVIKKEGYRDQTFHLTNKVGVGWIILDVIAGLVPVIIDAATGDWYIFNEKNFNAVLEKQQPRP